MQVRRVGVVGCGLMGSGIAQVAAMAGLQTIVREVSEPLLDKGLASVKTSLAKFVEKGTLTADQAAQAHARLRPTLKLAELADCDLVIEAATENAGIKKETFRVWRDEEGRVRCSCADYEAQVEAEPRYRCEHILAVKFHLEPPDEVPHEATAEAEPLTLGLQAALILPALGTLALGIFPNAVLNFANQSAIFR